MSRPIQFTPPKTPNMLQMARQGGIALPVPYPDVAMPQSLDAAQFDTPQAPAPTPAALATPTPPAAPPESAVLSSKLSALERPPSPRQSLLDAVLAFAPTAVAGLAGGLPAAAGAAQGANAGFAAQNAQNLAERKSLVEQVQAARQREQQAGEFTAGQGLRREEMAAQDTRNANTISAENRRSLDTRTAEMDRLRYQTEHRTTPNIDPLSPAGVAAALQRTRGEAAIPGRPTPPMSPEAYSQQEGLARIRGDIAASNRVPPQGQIETVTGPDGKPSLVRVTGTNVSQIELPPGLTAGKPSVSLPGPTERNMLGFYERVSNSMGQIDSMESDISKLGVAGQARLRYAPNMLQTPVGQRFTQAANDFINASLRRESGAAISDAEYDRFSKIYFPQPGDTAATLTQKKKAREVQLDTLKTQAGRAYTEKYGAGPKVGDVVPIGGQNIKITVIHPDGTFDGDPQ